MIKGNKSEAANLRQKVEEQPKAIKRKFAFSFIADTKNNNS
jgi:hypothetical protein